MAFQSPSPTPDISNQPRQALSPAPTNHFHLHLHPTPRTAPYSINSDQTLSNKPRQAYVWAVEDETEQEEGQEPVKRGEQVPPVVDTVWCDPSAEIVLVSSDNVAFHVPAYHILSQSIALRDAIQIDSTFSSSRSPSSSSPITIHFSDEECETSDAIRLFLFLISPHPLLPSSSLSPSFPHLHSHLHSSSPPSTLDDYILSHPTTITLHLLSTLLFLQKYDCPLPLSLLTAHLRHHALTKAHFSREICALDLFLIGAKTGIEGLCVDAVKGYKPRVGSGDEAEVEEDERAYSFGLGYGTNGESGGESADNRARQCSTDSTTYSSFPHQQSPSPLSGRSSSPSASSPPSPPMHDGRYSWGLYTGLNPSHFPILAWEGCPPLFCWALSKAVGAIKPGRDGLGSRSSLGAGTGGGAEARVEGEEDGRREARGRKGLWEKRGEVLEGILEEVRFLR
ncbi:hypothetical protein I314_03260 [Cryptococcus bacillisporus CA1873]|uniref:BTB domain-containing protein n=1 Tax=Cryptococcus bacillisporus CA1873 TaxID=1296111 RepID=A0ABR5BC24_CRYGA|nr:hypothetical protein I314_03260 [Cryptococcus bacillisporus CA1873]|eukprot:KIR63853.1 hypothetical protein I314_03260 [Cryptococcus gattii CA1873]